MSPARARTRTARSGNERTNHEATAPPTSRKKLGLYSTFMQKSLINDDVLLLLYPSYISHNLRELSFNFLQPSHFVLWSEGFQPQNKMAVIKKLDFSTGRVFIKRDKHGNTELLILMKYILSSIKQLQSNLY